MFGALYKNLSFFFSKIYLLRKLEAVSKKFAPFEIWFLYFQNRHLGSFQMFFPNFIFSVDQFSLKYLFSPNKVSCKKPHRTFVTMLYKIGDCILFYCGSSRQYRLFDDSFFLDDLLIRFEGPSKGI